MKKIAIDIGYSSTKIVDDKGKMFKIPTAISFAIDTGINYGEDEIYKFENDMYRVGEIAVDEAFTTTDYKFLNKFIPLIIFHILKKLNLLNEASNIELRTGLALTDWNNKAEFIERIKNIKVNDQEIILNNIKLIPQGAGCYVDYKENHSDFNSASVIDIGYNTINYLYFENNLPIRSKCKSFPNHGVVSIVRPLTNWMESNFSLKFTEQEIIKILLNNNFIFNGESQANVTNMIKELKKNFIQKLFNSILVSEKKLLGTSEVVILAGGGAYLIDDVKFPKNTKLVEAPYEFSNVRGYYK